MLYYKKAKTDLIHRSIKTYSWRNRFCNTDTNQNWNNWELSHETIACDYRNPSCIIRKIKKLIKKKNAKKLSLQNNNYIHLFRGFQGFQKLLTATIQKSKDQFYWLYVPIISRTRYKVNPHSIFAWIPKTSCLKQVWIWSLSDCKNCHNILKHSDNSLNLLFSRSKTKRGC